MATKEYIAAAEVINNGILNNVKVDGKLTMGAGSRINGEIDATTDGDGEINNTAKGVIVDDPTGKSVVIYAEFNGLNLVDNDARNIARNSFKEYTKSYKVTVARLTGEVVIRDNDAYFMKKDMEGTTITEIEFAEGSSLTIGDAVFSTDLTISVSAKNVEWTGNSVDASTFNMNSINGVKKLYKTTDGNNNYTATEGNVWFRNCQVKSSLGSATPVE